MWRTKLQVTQNLMAALVSMTSNDIYLYNFWSCITCDPVDHVLVWQHKLTFKSTGLEKKAVRSSRTNVFPLTQVSFSPSLPQQARTKASRSLTKYLIMILTRKVLGSMVIKCLDEAWRKLQYIALFCGLCHAQSRLTLHMIKICPNQISIQDINSHVGNENAVFISYFFRNFLWAFFSFSVQNLTQQWYVN